MWSLPHAIHRVMRKYKDFIGTWVIYWWNWQGITSIGICISHRPWWQWCLSRMRLLTSLCPYSMLFRRDVVLPVDNLLKPRKKYTKENQHRLIIEQQDKLFTQAWKRTKMAQQIWMRGWAKEKEGRVWGWRSRVLQLSPEGRKTGAKVRTLL